MAPKEAELGIDVMSIKAGLGDPLDTILLGQLRQARDDWAQDYLRRVPESALHQFVSSGIFTLTTLARILHSSQINGTDDVGEMMGFIRDDSERIPIGLDAADRRRFGGALAVRLARYPDPTSDRAMLDDAIICAAEDAAWASDEDREMTAGLGPSDEIALAQSNIFDTRIHALTVLGMLLDLSKYSHN